MDRALEEFARHGYGASSINAICGGQDVSKGIIYHYFETKDALFLACVAECFQRLTEHIQTHLTGGLQRCGGQLEQYFRSVWLFFRQIQFTDAFFVRRWLHRPPTFPPKFWNADGDSIP